MSCERCGIDADAGPARGSVLGGRGILLVRVLAGSERGEPITVQAGGWVR